MRGGDTQQGHLWSYLQPEQRVPQDHPLRPIRAMVAQALTDLSPRFALLYSHTGRPSIPPEQLLRNGGPGRFRVVKASPSSQRPTTSLRSLSTIPGLSRAAPEGPLPRSIVVVLCGTGSCRAQPA